LPRTWVDVEAATAVEPVAQLGVEIAPGHLEGDHREQREQRQRRHRERAEQLDQDRRARSHHRRTLPPWPGCDPRAPMRSSPHGTSRDGRGRGWWRCRAAAASWRCAAPARSSWSTRSAPRRARRSPCAELTDFACVGAMLWLLEGRRIRRLALESGRALEPAIELAQPGRALSSAVGDTAYNAVVLGPEPVLAHGLYDRTSTEPLAIGDARPFALHGRRVAAAGADGVRVARPARVSCSRC
jgi:hypothetical protein